MALNRWSVFCLASVAVCFFGTAVNGVTIVPTISGGLMQQPTSNYYLACYGLAVDLQASSFIARVSYTERPEFSRNGFAEKDSLGLVMAGMSAKKILKGDLKVFFGAGSASGYVAGLDDQNKKNEQRTYQLPGPAAAVEYSISLGKVSFAINHTTFVGYGGKDQTQAFVAWPYNLYFLSTGYSI
jgi:hypothetical protein